MRKIISKIAGTLLGLSLAVGVGVVLANRKSAEVKADDLTFSHSAITGMPTTGTADVSGSYGGFTFDVSNGCNASESVRVYKNHTITITSSVGNMTSVEFTCTATGTNKYGPGCLSGSGYTAGTAKVGTWTGNAESFTLTASADQARISDFKITYTPLAGPSIGVNPSSLWLVNEGESKNVTVSHNNFSSTPTISVEGTPSYVTPSINGLTVSLAPKAVGSETITIKGTYGTQTATKTVDVIVYAKHGLVEDDPFTVAEARAAIDAGGPLQSVYVSGKISQKDSFSSGSIIYWISDDGSTTNQFEIYYGKGLNNTNFTSLNDIDLGATVVNFGNIKKYNSTYEFDSGSYLKSYSAPSLPKYTVSFVANGGDGEMESVQVIQGNDYTLPACTFTAPEGKVFDHWEVGGVEVTALESVTADVVVTATWKDAPAGPTVGFVFKDHYSTNTVLDDVDIELDGYITATFTKGSAATQYYTNGTAVRWYGGGTLTIECASGSISCIVLKFSGGHANAVSADVGTYVDCTSTSGDGTWTGNASKVVFTESGSSGQDRISEIDVYYEASGEIYTITYDGNGATGGEMSPTVGANPVVAACSFENEGYTFARWNSQPDGDGDDYEVGATLSESKTLYAIWQEVIEPIGADVTMNAGDNSSSAKVVVNEVEKDAIKCGSGSKKGVMTLNLTKANITKVKVYIAGWNGSSETYGLEISIDNDATVSPSSVTIEKDTGVSGSSSTYTLAGQESTYRVDLEISEGAPANTVITISAKNASNNRYVVWGATNMFAETFSEEFNSNLSCDVSGESEPTYGESYSWSYFASLYNGLDSEEQGRLLAAEYTVTGTGANTEVTPKGGTVESVAKAMAKYDYIVGKYGVSKYPNFINRTVLPLAGARFGISASNNANASTIIIVVVALTSITSIGVLLVIKRKRSLVK